MSRQVISLRDEDSTKKFAAEFARKLKQGDVIELVGDLGSGKTFFVRALAENLGHNGASSPSFVIKNEYTDGDIPIMHYDFYRLEDPGIIREEIEDNVRQRQSIVIVEWGNSISDVLPDDRYKIEFSVTGEESRELIITR